MQLRLPLGSSGDLTVVSTAANELALRCGFGEIATERLVQAAQTAAQAMLDHAGGGTVCLRALQEEVTGAAAPQVELLAVDSPLPLQHRSASASGLVAERIAALAGLGTALDFHADAAGVALRMALSPGDRPGAVTLPPVSIGLVWASADSGQGGMNVHSTARLSTLVLGMGRATESARRVAALQGFSAQLQQIDRMHGALPEADDTAIAAIHLDPSPGQLKIAGAGSIDVWLAGPDGESDLPAELPADAAADAAADLAADVPADVPGDAPASEGRRPRQVLRAMPASAPLSGPRQLARAQAAWPAGTVLLIHGGPPFLPEQWQAWLDSHPGLLDRHPAIVAAVLHRDRRMAHAGGSVAVCRRTAECRSAAPWHLLLAPAPAVQPVAASGTEEEDAAAAQPAQDLAMVDGTAAGSASAPAARARNRTPAAAGQRRGAQRAARGEPAATPHKERGSNRHA